MPVHLFVSLYEAAVFPLSHQRGGSEKISRNCSATAYLSVIDTFNLIKDICLH